VWSGSSGQSSKPQPRKYNTQQIYAVFTKVNPYLRTAWRLSRT
jgi:hypothetical protein